MRLEAVIREGVIEGRGWIVLVRQEEQGFFGRITWGAWRWINNPNTYEQSQARQIADNINSRQDLDYCCFGDPE